MAYHQERREHERIKIRMKTRLWLDEMYSDRPIQFEGFAHTKDLAIGGAFIASSYLLPVAFPVNLEMLLDDGQILAARGEVVHCIQESPDTSEARPPGMGIRFVAVDAENRERLLRFFVSDAVKDFYFNRFVVEFPHLEGVLTLKDVALTINLWEDREGRLTAMRKGETKRKAPRGRRGGAGRRS